MSSKRDDAARALLENLATLEQKIEALQQKLDPSNQTAARGHSLSIDDVRRLSRPLFASLRGALGADSEGLLTPAPLLEQVVGLLVNLDANLNTAISQPPGSTRHLADVVNHFWALNSHVRSVGLFPTPYLPTAVAQAVRELQEQTALLEGTRTRYDKLLALTDQTINAKALGNAFEEEARQLRTPKRLWLTAIVALNATVVLAGALLWPELPAAGERLWPELITRALIALPIGVLDWLLVRQYGYLGALEREYRFKATAARAVPHYVEMINSSGNSDRSVSYIVEMSRGVLFVPPKDAGTHTPMEEIAKAASMVRDVAKP